MIKDIRKICGYNTLEFSPGVCFHPLNTCNMKYKYFNCSSEVCPFINYIKINTGENHISQKSKVNDYLLIK
jgi:hypothetical protein